MQVDRVHKEFKPLSRSNIKKELGPPKKVSIIQTQFFNRGGWNNFGNCRIIEDPFTNQHPTLTTSRTTTLDFDPSAL